MSDLLSKSPYTFDRFVRLLISIAVILSVFFLLNYLRAVLLPFAIATVFAYLLNPLVNFIQRYIKLRLAAVIITLILFFGILILAGYFIFPLIAKEIVHIWNLVSELITNNTVANQAEERVPGNLWEYFDNFRNRPEVQQFFTNEDLSGILSLVAQKLLPGVWGILEGTASFIFGLFSIFLIILYMLFILKDYNSLGKFGRELLPDKYKDRILDFYYEFEKIMNRYFRGQALIATSVGLLFATGFWIIGLPLGIVIGLFMGMLNMVPYLQGIGFIPITISAVFYALETNTSFFYMFGLAVLVVALVQTLQDTILVPRIMGKVTGFNPAIILLSLTIWGRILGMFGLIIALPLTYLLLAYYRKYLDKTRMEPGTSE